MTNRTTSTFLVSALCAGVVATAFVNAPDSCEGGLLTYTAVGGFSCVALAAVPLLLGRRLPLLRRTALSVGLALMGAGVWVVGLLASGMRVICRLF